MNNPLLRPGEVFGRCFECDQPAVLAPFPAFDCRPTACPLVCDLCYQDIAASLMARHPALQEPGGS